MDGDQYIKYRESRRLKFPKEYTKNIMGFCLAIFGSLLLVLFVGNIVEDPVQKQKTFAQEIQDVVFFSELTWNQIAKLTVVVYGSWIVIAVGIAWIVHGFGFIVVRR